LSQGTLTAILERQGTVRDPTVKHAFERILIRLPDDMTGVYGEPGG
jgi:hypothetical protein